MTTEEFNTKLHALRWELCVKLGGEALGKHAKEGIFEDRIAPLVEWGLNEAIALTQEYLMNVHLDAYLDDDY